MVLMSEGSKGAYEPGTYSKGESVRVAETPSDAVDLVWNGYSRVTVEAADDTPYDELKAQAKTLGIPVKGKKADLAQAIADFQPEDTAQGTPSEVPDTSAGQVSTDPTTDTPTAPEPTV